ncbi:FtsX-like permease family protein [Glycomyces sp. NPDC021274]|uniref:FtsX-like permease family protein n=1 Tax=Glycomyces sp. NPDC021274 TaxID=3155120 RepID=UPI0033C365B9
MGRLLASQRLAFRIARREALRYKGRSALSITLLGLPLLAVAIGVSAYDTMTLSDEENALQHLGENDAFIQDTGSGIPIEQYSWSDQWASYGSDEEWVEGATGPTEGEILNALPIGSWIVPYSFDGGWEEIQVQTPDGLGSITAYGYNLSDELYEKAGVEFLDGSAPGKGEVVLSEAAAEHLELGVGDMLVADQTVGTQEAEVSGIVEIPWNLNERFAIGSMFSVPSGGWLLDTPEELTYEDALALNELGVTVWATSLIDRPMSEEVYYSEELDSTLFMIIGLIVVVVAMEVILLAGPAFAISARRRTREFALMSANGATPVQIRRIVLAGGVLFGLIAAFIAIALGVLVVFAGLPFLEGIYGYRSAGLRVMPWLQVALVGVAIATGLLSALAAAISASRVNVVAALMGRTPGRKGSKRWLVIGLLMLGAGVASGFAGVTMGVFPLMAAAIVLAQLGLVVCTPALLSAAAKLGRLLPLAPRMALREAGRNRGSAAPAIAAVLGVVAGGMVFSMYITADAERSEEMAAQELIDGTPVLTLTNMGDSDVEPDWESGFEASRPVLERHLDDVEAVEIPMYSAWNGCTLPLVEGIEGQAECSWTVTRPEANQCSYWLAEADVATEDAMRAAVEAAREDPNCNETTNDIGISSDGTPGSTDPRVVAAYTGFEGAELDEAVAFLEGGGVLVADPLAVTDEGTVVLEGSIFVWTENGEPETFDPQYLELPAMAVDDELLGFNKIFLSPEAAEQMGQTYSDWERQYLIETPTAVEGSVQEALAADLEQATSGSDVSARVSVTDYTDDFSFYMVLLVSGLCALVALGATAVSTGLIIAEQKKDMTTLGAVGAAPGLRKRFAMWQTLMIAVFGAGLGTVAGVIGYALIQQALNRALQFVYPFEVLYGWELPWAAIAVSLLAVPVLAAVGALVFTKARLPSERRLT